MGIFFEGMRAAGNPELQQELREKYADVIEKENSSSDKKKRRRRIISETGKCPLCPFRGGENAGMHRRPRKSWKAHRKQKYKNK